jgi:hypothetical protein
MEKLNKALIKVQSELKAPKGQYNSFGKYSYRSAEDILEAVKPLLAKNGLSMTISDTVHYTIDGVPFISASVTVTDGLDVVKASAQAGIDLSRKGMDIAQSFGSSSSYARKYALNGMFLIDDTKDSDATNTHGKSASQSSKPKASPSSDAFQKSVDYIKASKTKKIALEQVLAKYGDSFSDKQKEALGKFVK